MKKDPAFFLTHILESIATIEEYTSGLSEASFLSDRRIPGCCRPAARDYWRGGPKAARSDQDALFGRGLAPNHGTSEYFDS